MRLAEAGQRLHRPRREFELRRELGIAERLDGGVQRNPPARRPPPQLVERAPADPAGGNVDHPLQADVVGGVADKPQVGDHVPHLAALIEARRPHQMVGEPVAHERLFEGAGLGVGAVQDRHVGVAPALLADQASDLGGGARRLVVLVERVHQPDPVAAPVLRPQLLHRAPPVRPDHAACRVEDHARRAVVLLQLDHRRAGVVMLEAEDVANLRLAPGVDRLIGVAHGEEVRRPAASPGVGDEPGDAVLGLVGVLELVDHHVDVAPAQRSRTSSLRWSRVTRRMSRSSKSRALLCASSAS